MSEETQGQHIVEAAKEAGVECFLWSTLPSSLEISSGKFMTRLYEGMSKSPQPGIGRNLSGWDEPRKILCRCCDS